MSITRFHDSSVGTKFLNVSNRDLVNVLESAFPGQPLEILTPRNHGTGVMAKVSIPDLSFNIPELGGLHTPTLFLRNANDGGLALTVGVGLFRAICLNGLYSGFAAFGAKIKHIDGPRAHELLDVLPAKIMGAMAAIQSGEIVDTALDLLETKVADPIQVVGNLPGISNRTKDRVIDAIVMEAHRSADRPDTAWGLYNLINEVARKGSRSLYRAAVNDVGLMDNIVVLANDKIAA